VTGRATFFYDLGSPYAWLAAERVHAVLGPDVEWVPVLLGGIFHATGRSSWARTPARAAGIAEIEARAAARGLPPLRWPDPWPNDGLQVMRAATWAHRQGRGREFALAAFRVHFTEGVPLSEPEGIARSAERAGVDPRATRAATNDPDIKLALRAATDNALAAGVLGVPTVLAAGALFWGDDQLEAAARLQSKLAPGAWC
jgi:2-hydroxychromene-2-carboxylate isomerase